ncbi:MAG: universal stress protein [Thermodesulfobacteriota bacterium]
MANIFKALQDTMAAAAFAEANEHESAREFLRAGKNRHKKILLGTDETELQVKAVTYAINMCARLGTGLEIIQVFPATTLRDLAGQRSGDSLSLQDIKQEFARRGIGYEFFFGKSSLDEEIIRHTAKRRDIMLFMLKMSGREENRHKTEKDLVRRFQCPVVILEDPLPA